MAPAAVFGLAFCAIGVQAQSSYPIYPALPTSADNIVLSFPLTICPTPTPLKDWYRVAMVGGRIRITLGPIGRTAGQLCPSAPPGIYLYADVGRLPAGNYVIDVMKEASDGTTTVAQSNIALSVSDGRAGKILPYVTLNYSGHWWDPTDPGSGIFIWHDEKDNVIAAWFTYGEDGKPVWYTIQAGRWTSFGRYEGQLITTGRPGANRFVQDNTVVATPVGTAILQFFSIGNGDSHGDEGQLIVTRNSVTETRVIRRFKA